MKYNIVEEKDKIILGNNLNLQVLSPGLNLTKGIVSHNDMSLVFLLNYLNCVLK